ncbi:tRNA lysidine(34) synthetase TilS [Parasphingorhabdus sp.]|uniref:tRNA lysidine(34) synthetase TilS n=1 Tax=Parasphingorhabdus sp. TaxID=2709688 RepID=UPI003D2A0039
MPSSKLVERFSHAVNRLLPDFRHNDEIMGLAVSGGPDSLALLLLANLAFPKRIAAATIDHDLRPEAAAEARFVATICAKKNIPHQIFRPTLPISGNVQSVARQVRYELLHDWMKRDSIHWLATAHHADDQLETMIMRLLRGSGVDGLSGIREKRGEIIRPLLHFQKTELEQYIADQGIQAIDDPSNHNPSYDRVRVREALKGLIGFDSTLASQSGAALNDARDALEWITSELADSHIEHTFSACTLKKTDFPHEIRRRLLLRCLHICDPSLSPRGAQIDQTLQALDRGETVTLGNLLCKGGAHWSFEPAPKRRNH